MTWKAPEVTRYNGPVPAGERATLQFFLDWQRATLLFKCAGLTGDQLAERMLPPSDLSLLGLIRHLTDVERAWFRQRFADEPVEDAYGMQLAWQATDPTRAAADYARLTEEFKLTDAAAENAPLEAAFSHNGEALSLRFIYLHMIEEYARHNGHADLLRERIDGATGELGAASPATGHCRPGSLRDMTSSRALVSAYWAAAEARDWEAFGRLLADNVVYEAPMSHERVDGKAAYIRFNAEGFPGDWHLSVMRIVADEATAASWIRMADDDDVYPGLTFFEIADGLIAGITDFWPQRYEPSASRAHLTERI